MTRLERPRKSTRSVDEEKLQGKRIGVCGRRGRVEEMRGWVRDAIVGRAETEQRDEREKDESVHKFSVTQSSGSKLTRTRAGHKNPK